MIVNAASYHRVRHAMVQRRERVLNDDHATCLPDARRAGGTVHACSGENDHDRMRRLALRKTFEK